MKKCVLRSLPFAFQPILSLESVKARASPIAMALMTLDVGAGSAASASSETFSESSLSMVAPVDASSHSPHAFARIDSESRVMATRCLTLGLTIGKRRISSAVAPECEIMSRASHGDAGLQGHKQPRSPCSASTGCKKTAGTPAPSLSACKATKDPQELLT